MCDAFETRTFENNFSSTALSPPYRLKPFGSGQATVPSLTRREFESRQEVQFSEGRIAVYLTQTQTHQNTNLRGLFEAAAVFKNELIVMSVRINFALSKMRCRLHHKFVCESKSGCL